MNPPVPIVQLLPAFGSVFGHAGGVQRHVVPPMPPPQVQLLDPKSHVRPSVVHVEPSIGSVPGQVPQDHMPPMKPPPAQLHVVPPYVQAGAVAQAKPPMHAPVGCVAGHAGHVVQNHVGPPIPPPKQSHTAVPPSTV
jgi:hypothetical protein